MSPSGFELSYDLFHRAKRLLVTPPHADFRCIVEQEVLALIADGRTGHGTLSREFPKIGSGFYAIAD
jgi:hypothetical protein